MPRKARKKDVSERSGPSARASHKPHHFKRDIGAVLLLLLGTISILGFFDAAGELGDILYLMYRWILGGGFWLFPLALIAGAFGLFQVSYIRRIFSRSRIGLALVVVSFLGLLQMRIPSADMQYLLFAGMGGGVIGYGIVYPLIQSAGALVTLLVLIASALVGILLIFRISVADLRARLNLLERLRIIRWNLKLKSQNEYEEDTAHSLEDEEGRNGVSDREPEKTDGIADIEFVHRSVGTPSFDSISKIYPVTPEPKFGDSVEEAPIQKQLFRTTSRKHPKIDLPVDLLQGKAGIPQSGDIDGNKRIIEQTLAHFGIQVEMGAVAIGPTVTQYTFRPAEGVKLSRITALANDLALALAAHPIRIEAPIPNKSLVGIEVPNQRAALVPLKDIIDSPAFKRHASRLALGLGKDVSGEPYIADLSEMPHLLIAGATGSGKSVMINTVIVSMLYRNQPDQLKFIMVDPKRVELRGYNDIPHLLTPVITDVEKTINALRWVVGEMDRRFDLLSHHKKRHFAAYNLDPIGEPLPYIVVIIDELADLMSVAPAEIEAAIVRLAQMARAVGIHLILATQRPSVDVITGLIKANITARIAFSVASLIDSRTILDTSGAEKLVGRGDMLFLSATVTKPKRLQGSYLSDAEIERVVAYLKSKDKPEYLDDVVRGHEKFDASHGGGTSHDPLFTEARELVVTSGKASTSFLQRRLRLGYARAARLMDLLEEAGVVGPADGAKQREVLMTTFELASAGSDSSSGDPVSREPYGSRDTIRQDDSREEEEYIIDESDDGDGTLTDEPLFGEQEEDDDTGSKPEGERRRLE